VIQNDALIYRCVDGRSLYGKYRTAMCIPDRGSTRSTCLDDIRAVIEHEGT
jgi:hypothetical protein